jgi:hypothetical protein
MTRLQRAIPFAVAGFMLTPLVLWAVLWASGMRGAKSGFDGPEAVVLILSSLPLAGLFWIRNLREMGDALGLESRLGLARLLTAVLPAAVLLIGLTGLLWLAEHGRPASSLWLVGVAVAVVAALAWLAAGGWGEAATARRQAARRPGATDTGTLLFIANVAMVLALLAYYWTPVILFYAVLALVPLAFIAIIVLANQDNDIA